MDETQRQRIVELRCGRVRRNGERCRHTLAKVLIGDGELEWLTPMAIGDGEAPRFRRPPRPAMLPDVEEGILRGEPGTRWQLVCHRRCGAVYTVTRSRLVEFDPLKPVVYLGGPPVRTPS